MRVVVIGVVGLVVVAVCACKQHDAPPAALAQHDRPIEHVVVPGSKGGDRIPPQPIGGELRPLEATEGTLAIDKAKGAPGTLTAHVRVAPAAGFHVNVGYPMSLALQPTAGVTLAKTRLVKADAETFDEHGLALTVAATVERPGAYAVTGTFDFAVCDERSCRPKHQPIAIDFVAE